MTGHQVMIYKSLKVRISLIFLSKCQIHRNLNDVLIKSGSSKHITFLAPPYKTSCHFAKEQQPGHARFSSAACMHVVRKTRLKSRNLSNKMCTAQSQCENVHFISWPGPDRRMWKKNCMMYIKLLFYLPIKCIIN